MLNWESGYLKEIALSAAATFILAWGCTATAVAQTSEPAIAADYHELRRRLEATESELRELRVREEERTAREQTAPDAIEATAPLFSLSGHETNPHQLASCTCDTCEPDRPVCAGCGPLCEDCQEKLSWNKGSWRIVPFGNLTGEAISTGTATTARPMILYLNSDLGVPQDRFIVHGQTTALGLNFSGPTVGSFQLGGMILFNFLGDRPVLNQATPFFLRGYGELKSDEWRFAFGQQGDLFNPLDPTTVNFGGHKQAGNAGAFRGSLRAERYLRPSDSVQWTLQAALSQQAVNDFIILPVVAGTDNGTPNVEARVGLGLGDAVGGKRPVEVGVSGVVGETRAIGLDSVVSDTWGTSLDASISGECFGLRGEILTGEAIGTYNAGIGQSLNPLTLNAIQTTAGWLELWIKLTECLTFHVGYGRDDPRNADLGQFLDPTTLQPFAGQRARNEICWANIIWDVTKEFDVGWEISRRETEYIAPGVTNSGMIYHFRARLTF